MPISENFKRKVKKLPSREWEDLKNMWLKHPDAAYTPLCPPQHELSELQDITSYLKSTNPNHPQTLEVNLPNVRISILKYAFFCLQKAAFTFRSASTIQSTGTRCWCLATAYFASLQASRSITALLGVQTATVNRFSYLVDVHSDRIIGNTKKNGKQFRICIIDANTSINHKESWLITQHLLRSTKFPPPIKGHSFLKAIQSLRPEQFGWQRNQVYYHSSYWPFDELRRTNIRDDFASYSNEATTVEQLITPEDSLDFSIQLAVATLRIGFLLGDELAKSSLLFATEINAAKSALNGAYPQSVPQYT